MYYKYGVVLLFLDLIMGIGIVTLEPYVVELGVQIMDEKKNVFVEMVKENKQVVVDSRTRWMEETASGQRTIDYEIMDEIQWISFEDYEVLCKIVEAEAGCEDEDGKVMVADVVLNRVKSEVFPNTVTEVVYQKTYGITQFSPVSNGRIKNVNVSEETYRAVDRALEGEDLTEGALYFAARCAAEPDKMEWFDNHLTFMYAYGGHEFFR